MISPPKNLYKALAWRCTTCKGIIYYRWEMDTHPCWVRQREAAYEAVHNPPVRRAGGTREKQVLEARPSQ